MPIKIDRRKFLGITAAGITFATMPGLVRRANAAAPAGFANTRARF